MSAASPERSPGSPNALRNETSPYLQQHARNPVDWHPWGDEALAMARQLDRPIFLSIGYSACHWCHVMEHESFENADIEALMNTRFINIKVDREERPDLDQIYMNAVQLMTGRGGWPMSVFLTPDLQPFFGGTYWPPRPRLGMPGFRDILEKVAEAWNQRRDDVLRSAGELTAAVQQAGALDDPAVPLDDSLLRRAQQRLTGVADRRLGGFGGAPKFPHPMDLRVLLRCWKRFHDSDALDIVRLTLDRMADGGIYDHLGGGFHRYSTDERWLVPHFEKMLYDNALLVAAYLDAFQATGELQYARVARETLDYVLREMTSPEGGFYSTQDADSEGVEGKFFVWTQAEVIAVLGADDAGIFCERYDITPRGNWEGHCILNRSQDRARAPALSPEDPHEELLQRCRSKLLAARGQRGPPGRDDKVLAGWNGLMISAFSRGALVLGEPRYATAARQAADFVLQTMRDETGALRHSYKDGQSRFNAYLDDYACLIEGLVDVYQATFEPACLTAAVRLAERMLSDFSDPAGGGFYYTAHHHEQLITRLKDIHDNATPSGNGSAATALLRLGRLCGRSDLEQAGYETLRFLSPVLAQSPLAAGQALLALDFHLGPVAEVVLVPGEADDHNQLLQALQSRYLPNLLLAMKPAGIADDQLPPELRPLLQGKVSRGEASTVYVCERGACGLPGLGLAGLEPLLRKMS
jgi:uncharacterized protein YyaL (SSP411 family)